MTLSELNKPLDPKNVKQRQMSGRNMSYIEAHHAIREANRIFGFDGWDRATEYANMVQCEEKTSPSSGKSNWYVGYIAKVQIHVMHDGQHVMREGTGFGQGQDADLGRAHESAIKEAESDAMKRALMTFGDPFGLALYDKDQTHVGVPEPEYQKPAALPPTASPEEVKRNGALFWTRQIMQKPLTTAEARAESKTKQAQIKAIVGDDAFFDVLLQAEQEDVTSFEGLLEFAQGMRSMTTK